jgi:hypothetical protein
VASLPSRNHHALAVAAVEATDSSTKDSSHWIFLVVATSLAAAATSSSSVAVQVATRCDDNDDNDTDDKDNDNVDEVEEDPYDNLPEEDEPTHCSICMSYRQGPCRPYWRKVEACMKANESPKKEEGGDDDGDDKKKEEEEESDEPRPDPPCFKYMMPWIDCAQGYSNMYNLIELETNYAEGIADLEKEATQSLCWSPLHEPKIDWSTWQTYVEENEEWKLPKKKKTTSSSSDSEKVEKVTLWKTLDQSKDPEMVNVEATVAMTLGEGVLECAYALDQDGNVIGFSYGTRPSEAAEKKGADKHENPSVPLTIRIVPTRTRRVTIAASYTQPKKEDADEKDPRENHSYKSRPYSLKKMAKK